MARIDTSKISGYDKMTPEDKIKALEALTIPDEVDMTKFVRKEVFDKKASEASDLDKRLKEKMTEDEKKQQEDAEARTRMEQELAELRRESSLAKAKTQFLALGYDADLADDTALAFVDGDTAKLFANQQKYIESVRKAAIAEAMKNTPDPKGGNGGDTMTVEKFRTLSPSERAAYANEHPQEYSALYGGSDS